MVDPPDPHKPDQDPAQPFEPRRLAMPWDLSEWVSREELWGWTLEVVDGLGWDQPALVDYLAAWPNYRPQILLTLISYGYCIGVFEDGEVAELAFQNPPAATIRGELSPRRRAVAEFRKANRGLIKWVLVSLFRRVLKARYQVGGTLLPAGLKRYLVRAATARLDLARTMIRATEEA